MLIERSVLEQIPPLAHHHSVDDTGMKIVLAWRARFDYVDEPLVVRGRADEPLSQSWSHIDGRELLLWRYADLYEIIPGMVYREDATQTYYCEGQKRLEEVHRVAVSCPGVCPLVLPRTENRAAYLSGCLASALRRPGLRIADVFK